MNITLIGTGRITERYVAEGMQVYLQRLPHYCKFILAEIESGKGSDTEIRKKESAAVLRKLDPKDFLILLDERGKDQTSVQLAQLIGHHQNISTRNLVFLIGGAYGFSEEVYERADGLLSLSKMTFPHQLVRLIFLEQLYRAFTILKGEKYHH